MNYGRLNNGVDCLPHQTWHLGVFHVSRQQSGPPTATDVLLIEEAARLTAMAIEKTEAETPNNSSSYCSGPMKSQAA